MARSPRAFSSSLFVVALLLAAATLLFAAPAPVEGAKGPLVTKKVAFTIKQGDEEVC